MIAASLRNCRQILVVVAFLLATSCALAADVPPIDAGIWKFPHELEWKLGDGPTWMPVGHSATILTVQPVKKNEKVSAVRCELLRVTAFDDDGLPQAWQALGQAEFTPKDPKAKEAKRGLHRKENGSWDFGFGVLPAAPLTYHQRIFAQASSQFRYCVTFHGAGESAADSFAELRIAVMVAELLEDSDIPPTQSWPDGEPMPRGVVPSTNWHAKESVKAPWALSPTPITPLYGKLIVPSPKQLEFRPAAPRQAVRLVRELPMPVMPEELEADEEGMELQ